MHTGADPGFDRGGGGADRDRPKTAILGPQFCRILVLGPHFWWSGGPGAPPGSAPGIFSQPSNSAWMFLMERTSNKRNDSKAQISHPHGNV